MSYLTLSVDARQECRVAGTGPAAVTSQTGVLKDIVDWVSQAYTEIQERHTNWNWMRSTFTVNTVSGTDTYAYGTCTDSRLSATITRFARWWPLDEDGFNNMTCYLTSGGVSGEGYLAYLPWSQFRNRYKRGTQNNGKPIHVTIDPQRQLVFGPKPDDIYTINGEYQLSPQILAADGDTPEMPTQYHRLIVYRAMEKYGAANASLEVFQRGGLEGNRMMRALENDQLPKMEFG